MTSMARPKKTLLEWSAITAIKKTITLGTTSSQEKIIAHKIYNSLDNLYISDWD